MHLMYVDESGDPGKERGSTEHYILSGLIVPQQIWNDCLEKMKIFRKCSEQDYGLNRKTEIHAAELVRINKIEEYKKIRKCDRISLLVHLSKELPTMLAGCKIMNTSIDKSACATKEEVFDRSWNRLATLYSTFLRKSEGNEKGLIISDDTNAKRLMTLMRQMRTYNPVPSESPTYYNAPTDNIIEDVFIRSSHNSYFIQAADIIAFLLYQKEYPKSSLKKFNLDRAFLNLGTMLVKDYAPADPLGIVRK